MEVIHGEFVNFKHYEGWYTNEPIIANLSICRESRLRALKTHPLSFHCYGADAMIPFNFATATLLLGRKMRKMAPEFKRLRLGKDLAKVQSLMVDAELKWEMRSMDDRGLASSSPLCSMA